MKLPGGTLGVTFRILYLAGTHNLQPKDLPGIGSDFGSLADANGPDPNDLFPVLDEKHSLTYLMWDALSRQELADFLFTAQAKRDEPVTRSPRANDQR